MPRSLARLAAALFVAVLLVAVPGRARAQDEGEEPAAEVEGEAPPRLDVSSGGAYGGVVPGQAKKGGARVAKIPSKPTLTWVGFQPRDGGSRVFIQLSSDATFEQHVEGNELIVSIPDVQIGAKNFTRPLDTRFFDTAVTGVTVERAGQAKAKGKGKPRHRGGTGAAVHVKFKGPAKEAAARVEKGEDGYHYLYLDFPASAG